MDTKICVITGANSGIGKEAARLIAKEKVHVVMACRSKERAENAMHDILQADVSVSLEIMMLDMSRKASIEAFAQAFSKKYKKLDILIHNAADFDISRKEPTYTEDSIESVWAINHIGCVLLTERLMPCLANSTNGRIITISSKGLAMLPFAKIDIDDCEFKHKRYSVPKAYYQSKLAQEMFTVWFAKSLGESSVTINCIRVGSVQLDLSRYPNLPELYKKIYAMKRKLSITPERMAEIYARLALDESYAKKSGMIYDEHGLPLEKLTRRYTTERTDAVMRLTRTYL